MTFTRRTLLRATAAAPIAAAFPESAEPIQLRGYYFTFCRMPTLGYPEWTSIVDDMAADGANVFILWVAGGFRSHKFPITWRYNQDHKNVRSDFVGRLINYAHSKQIKVLLGFTPFSYDGVNQYTLEHPELKAVQKNGHLASLSGIHCWGYALNPSRPEAQKFMLDYVREMFFDFYPKADGFLIESSDYAICYCRQCSGHFYEREYQFVKAISEEVWRAKPDATILVYPHYFDSGSIPGFDVGGSKMPYDRRWTLFFTPHSTHLNENLIQIVGHKAVYWDASPVFKGPKAIQQATQIATKHRLAGYMPSLESYTFELKHPEGGEAFLEGTRLKPFGFDWMPDGKEPYRELLVRVNRIAYRSFTKNPDLPFAEFRSSLAQEIFGTAVSSQVVDDLLFLQESWSLDRSWFSPSPLTKPQLLRDKLAMGALSFDELRDYRSRLGLIRQIAAQYSNGSPAEKEMSRISEWIAGNWAGKDTLITDHLR
jgi:hypothetical protein